MLRLLNSLRRLTLTRHVLSGSEAWEKFEYKPLSQNTLREELNAKRQQVKELRKKKKQTEWTYEQTKTFKEKIKHKGQKIRVDPKTNKIHFPNPLPGSRAVTGDLNALYDEAWQPGKFESKRRPRIFGFNGAILVGDPVLVSARDFAPILRHWRRKQHEAYEWQDVKERAWREALRAETAELMIREERKPAEIEIIELPVKKVREPKKGLLTFNPGRKSGTVKWANKTVYVDASSFATEHEVASKGVHYNAMPVTFATQSLGGYRGRKMRQFRWKAIDMKPDPAFHEEFPGSKKEQTTKSGSKKPVVPDWLDIMS